MDHKSLLSCCPPNLLFEAYSCPLLTRLYSRFNTRLLLQFFFLCFSRYFCNCFFLLQELTYVESSNKLPFLTFPQVPEHFYCIVCLFVLRSIWFIYSLKMRALFSNEANYYHFVSKISHLSYVSMYFSNRMSFACLCVACLVLRQV